MLVAVSVAQFAACGAPLPQPDAAGGIRVVAYDRAAVAQNAPVLVMSRDGQAYVSATDTNGTVWLPAADGATITVLVRGEPSLGQRDLLYSFVAARNGDTLYAGAEPALATHPLTVQLPPLPPNAPVSIQTSCGRGTGTGSVVVIDIASACQTTDVFVDVLDEQTGRDAGTIIVLGVATQGGVVDLQRESLVANREISVTLAGQAEFASASVVAATGAGGLTVTSFDTNAESWQTPMLPVATTQRIPDFASGALVVDTMLFDAQGTSKQRIVERVAFGTHTIDTAMLLRPWLTSTPMWQDGTLSWRESAGASVDTVFASVVGTRPPEGAAPALAWTHRVLAPHGGDSLFWPTLVPPFDAYVPAVSDVLTWQVALAAFTGGYDTVRAVGLSVDDLASLVPVDGAAIVVSSVD